MKNYKKLLIGLLCVIVLGALVGVFAGCDLFERLGGEENPTSFTVTYYLEDGGIPHTVTVTDGKYSLGTIPTRPYCEFTGLYDAREGGMKIVDGNGNCFVTINRDMVLYAHWNYVQCKIIFNAERGELEESLQTKTLNYLDTLTTLPVPTYEGHRFVGWFTGRGTQVSDGAIVRDAYKTFNSDNYAINGTTTPTTQLYARYTVSEYTLTLDYNDPNYEKEEIPIQHGDSLDYFSLPSIDKDNRMIVGWSTDPYRLVEFEGTFTSDTILYAIWKEYRTIRLYDNPKSYPNRYTTEKVFKDEVFTLPTLTRTGYDFDGWYTSTSFSGNPTTEVLYSTQYTNFYARWIVKTYSISLDANGGTVSIASKTVKFDESFTLPVPSRNGYLFDGWYCGSSRVANKNGQSVSVFSNENWVNLVASWYNSGTFSDTTKKRITDSSATSQYYNTITVTSIFGYSLDQMKKLGISKISFRVTLNIAEINDGSQEMYFSRAVSTASSNLIWSKTNIEHGAGTKKTSSGDHTFTFDVSLSNMSETFYILYSAHGTLDDDWYRNSISITFTLS